MPKKITMNAENKGLTAKINFWSMEKYIDSFNPAAARKWIDGIVTNAETGETRHFHHAGDLLTILGEWNCDKFKALKKLAKLGKSTN